jgi:hypothetical protein
VIDAGDRKNLTLLAICRLLLDLSPADFEAVLGELVKTCRVRRVRKPSVSLDAARGLH